MKILSGNLLSAGVLNLILFLTVFLLLQQEVVYKNTLGKISYNYTRIENQDSYEIQRVKKPYDNFVDKKFNTWDADIYHCIKENMYAKDGGCYTQVKGAFFPLFPLLWKISGLNSIGISLFNYLLFILSIAILVQQLIKNTEANKLIIYSLLVTLPSSVIYYIPYTESLFLFTMTMLLTGALQNKYWLYFLASVALAMIRPATLFILIAILAIDFLCLLSHKKIGLFVRVFTKKALPFLIGYGLVILIQYASTSSFTTMLEAQNYWKGSIGWIDGISDWSLEGFGLNAFSVFFIAIPAICFLFYTLFRRKVFLSFYQESSFNVENASRYFLLVSVFYLSGVLLFILFSSGGNLHSFFRFTMTSPPFYIAFLILLNYLFLKKPKISFLFTVIPLLFLTAFLSLTEYGGSRFDFSFAGMYLSVLVFSFLFYHSHFSKRMQWLIAGMLILCSIVWNTYLLNIFFSDGWIFT